MNLTIYIYICNICRQLPESFNHYFQIQAIHYVLKFSGFIVDGFLLRRLVHHFPMTFPFFKWPKITSKSSKPTDLWKINEPNYIYICNICRQLPESFNHYFQIQAIHYVLKFSGFIVDGFLLRRLVHHFPMTFPFFKWPKITSKSSFPNRPMEN